MPINTKELGYLVISATDVEAWRSFCADYLGMQVTAEDGGRLAVRMDERALRLLIEPGSRDAISCVGLRLESSEAVRSAVEAFQASGVSVRNSESGERSARRVEEMVWLHDPDGNRVELFAGPRNATSPFRPGRAIGGFRTEGLGLGHAVFQSPNYEAMRAFYMERLGFHLSDYVENPFRASFMHANARHHSMAVIESSEARCHHFMVEYIQMDDVGRLHDLALKEPGRIMTTLGRHTNDRMLSFYSKTPGGFMIETGWGGVLVDMQDWQVKQVSSPSLWGHERSWLSPEARAQARRQVEDLAARGVFEPVEAVVSPGFSMGPGVRAATSR